MERFDSLYSLIAAMWVDCPSITHAWVRLCVSTGFPRSKFTSAYDEIRRIESLCGRRVLALPVWVDSHEFDAGEAQHSVDPDSGIYRISLLYSKKNVPAASCILLAVQAAETEQNETRSEGLLTLDGLESVLRMAIGKNGLITSPYTQHVRLVDGQTNILTEVQTFDHTEGPRTDGVLFKSALEIASATESLQLTKRRRLVLALHIGGAADDASRLLNFWTSYEVLAGTRGHKVYPFLARAYGEKSSCGQALAKQLLVTHAYEARCAQAHDGASLFLSSQALGYLSALLHDLVRGFLGLSPLKHAQTVLEPLRDQFKTHHRNKQPDRHINSLDKA